MLKSVLAMDMIFFHVKTYILFTNDEHEAGYET